MALSPIQSQMALQLTQQKGVDLSNIKGVVVAVEGQQVVVAVQGQRLTIAAEALTKAAVGQSLNFALVALGDGRFGLQLKALQNGVETPATNAAQTALPDAVGSSETGEEAYKGILKSQLKSYGVEATEANLSIAKAQRGQELPMNKGTFLQLKGLHFHLQALNNQLASIAAQGISLEGETLKTWLAEPEVVASDLGQRTFGSQGAFQQQPQLVGTPFYGTATEHMPGQMPEASPATAQTMAPVADSIAAQASVAAQELLAAQVPIPSQVSSPATAAEQTRAEGTDNKAQTTQAAQGTQAAEASATEAALTPEAKLQAAIAAAAAAMASPEAQNSAAAQNAIDKGSDIAQTNAQAQVQGQGQTQTLAQAQPPSGLVQLPTAHLSGRVQQLISNMVAEPEALDQTLAFMVKQGIPTNTLNIVISHQFLKGTLGFNAALTEVLEGALSALEGKGHPELSAIRQLLDKVKGQGMAWHQWPDTLDGAALKEQVTVFGEVAEALKQLSITSEQGEYQSQFDAIKQTANLSQEGQWTNLWLPQPLGQMLQDVEVYVKRDADKSKPVDPDNALLYIALDTEHLGRVRVKIQTKQTSISIVFMIAQDDVRRTFEQQSTTLFTALKKHTDKALHLVFQPTLDNANLAEFERVGREGLQLFDMWI